MSNVASEHIQCMEVWGGSHTASRALEMGGLNVWLYSRPYASAKAGGDVYYVSSCATGRINRFLLADVSGHGDAVASTAKDLRGLMRRYVNFLDQTQFVRSMNRTFSVISADGCFATAVATTFFAPTRSLSICNAGHPRPFLYRAATGTWTLLEFQEDRGAHNLPLGILDVSDYEQMEVELELDDLVLCYTDALIEAKQADGSFIGEEGVLEILSKLDAKNPATLTEALLAEIEGRAARNLDNDDVTVLLLRANDKKPKVSMGQQFSALMRMMGALVKSINPRAERAPLPDFHVANVGGAILPGLGKRWRLARQARRGSQSGA
jgi:phosphoserine phosphatase RsbU/P